MLANRVREYSTTVGTGNIALSGAMAGHVRFADGFSVGDSVIYVLEDGANYEIGTANLVTENLLERTAVEESLLDGELKKGAEASAISLSGQARIYCAATAEFLTRRREITADVIGEVTPNAGVTIGDDLYAQSIIADGSSHVFSRNGRHASPPVTYGGTVLRLEQPNGSMAANLEIVSAANQASSVLFGDIERPDGFLLQYNSSAENFSLSHRGDAVLSYAPNDWDFRQKGLSNIRSLRTNVGEGGAQIRWERSSNDRNLTHAFVPAGELSGLNSQYNLGIGANAQAMSLTKYDGGQTLSMQTWNADASVSLYYKGKPALQTQVDGVIIRDPDVPDGTSRAPVLRFENHDGSGTAGFVQSYSSGVFVVRNQNLGSPIILQGTDESGIIQPLLQADPDGEMKLFHGGVLRLNTTPTGVQIAPPPGTIAGANIENAGLLVGDTSIGLGLDTNEIVAAGSDLYMGALDGFTQIRSGNTALVTFATSSATFRSQVIAPWDQGYKFNSGDALISAGGSGGNTVAIKGGGSGANILVARDASGVDKITVDSEGRFLVGTTAATRVYDTPANPFGGQKPSLSVRHASNGSANYSDFIHFYNDRRDETAQIRRQGIKLSLSHEASEHESLKSGVLYMESTEPWANHPSMYIRPVSALSQLHLGAGENDKIISLKSAVDNPSISLNNKVILADSEIVRDVADSSVIFSGGNQMESGANVVLYGQSHATQANDIRFRSGAHDALNYDYSGGVWNFRGNSVAGISGLISSQDILIDKPSGTARLWSKVAADDGIGGVVLENGTQRYDIQVQGTDTQQLLFHDTTLYQPLYEMKGGASGYHRFYANNALAVSIGSSGHLGIGMAEPSERLHIGGDDGEATLVLQRTNEHSPGATIGDIEIRDKDGLVKSRILTNAGSAEASNVFFGVRNSDGDFVNLLQLNGSTRQAAIAGSLVISGLGSSNLLNANNDTVLIISGGAATKNGANYLAYAENHTSAANDHLWRVGASPILHWDNSENHWNFQNKDLTALGNMEAAGTLKVEGSFSHGTPIETTIISGSITVGRSFHIVDTENGATTDDLVMIEGGVSGQRLILVSASDTRQIIIRNSVSGDANLQLAGDLTLSSPADTIELIFDGSNWLELSRSHNNSV